jgi:hypothetical protein
VAIGSGNSIVKADSNGLYAGNATFASAPFRVTPAGALTATSLTVLTTGGAIALDVTGATGATAVNVTNASSSAGIFTSTAGNVTALSADNSTYGNYASARWFYSRVVSTNAGAVAIYADAPNGATGLYVNGPATITGTITGTTSGNLVSGGALGTPSSGTLTNCSFPTLNQNTTGSANSLLNGGHTFVQLIGVGGGSKTATFLSTTKPGSNDKDNVWFSTVVDSTTYYIPGWAA